MGKEKPKKDKSYVTNNKGEKTSVSKSSTTAAKNRTGTFKQKEWKGKTLVDDYGNMYGIKKQDGSIKKSKGGANKKGDRKLIKELAADKSAFSARKARDEEQVKRFKKAKKKA